MSGRALLTETERAVLAREKGNEQYRATVRSRLRDRIKELDRDVDVLAEHEPELLAAVEQLVE